MPSTNHADDILLNAGIVYGPSRAS
ncbi:hypothetical protein [Paraglaciecola mesophila]